MHSLFDGNEAVLLFGNMISLPKRWVRSGVYVFLLSTIVLFVLLLPNHEMGSEETKLQAKIDEEVYVTDIVIEKCSKLGKGEGPCSISESSSRKKNLGEWLAVEKDLALKSSWTTEEYLYYKVLKRRDYDQHQRQQNAQEQKKRKDSSNSELVVVDVAIGNSEADSTIKGNRKAQVPLRVLQDVENMQNEGNGGAKAEANIIPSKGELAKWGWTYKSHGIWLKYGKPSEKAVTAINVLFGDDAVDPRSGWTFLKEGPIMSVRALLNRPPFLSFRRGRAIDHAHNAVGITTNEQGKLKVLQVADLHFSTGVGICRDPSPPESGVNCQADPRTLRFLNRVLDIEKPDMVVLTGDQVFGKDSPDAESSLFKVLAPFVRRKIPFAVTLGNHDDEGSLNRAMTMKLSCDLPYSVASMGPNDVDGVGNYITPIFNHNKSAVPLLFYFLDTHKASLQPKVNPGYDWIKPNQLLWIQIEDERMREELPVPTESLGVAFFHIPLPEYRNPSNYMVGSDPEGITAPYYNTNARAVLSHLGVKVISVGHDHCNDFCFLDGDSEKSQKEPAVWLCYGGGSGEGGYGGYGGYVRRLRIYDFDTAQGSVSTWKRQENNPDEIFDFQVMLNHLEPQIP